MSEGTRRLAAIMFTDMVGYTALGQRNESLSLALAEEQRRLVRPIMTRRNGREVKTMGDAFLIEFPSALEAVRCAYEIQRATREFGLSSPVDQRIHLRIGVHLGDVVGSQGDISGDAVNVASRIEALAEDGGVCITRQVYDHVQNKFEIPLTSLGKKALKNVSEPMEVFKMAMPWQEEKEAGPAQYDKRRIAVLPFANMSPDPNDEYFADGMTEELLTTLSKVSGLSVISRTSVMQYRKATKPIKEVARELETGTILEGSVRKSGETFRIAVQMIDATNDQHLWAENYDRDLKDVFAVQGEIARKVTNSVRVRLFDDERARIDKIPTEDVDAYTFYLKGNFHARKSTKEGLEKSLECYQQALERDSKYAPAYSGMAEAYLLLGLLSYRPEKETYPKARELAEKAIELDEALADGHFVLGEVLLEHFWVFSGADSELRRSIELNPSHTKARLVHSWLLGQLGKDQEALEEVHRAVRLDPNSSETFWRGSYSLYLLTRFSEAVEYGEKALEIDPSDIVARTLLGIFYTFVGRCEEGIQEGLKAFDNSNNAHQFAANLACTYALCGKTEHARKILDGMIETSRKEHVAAILFAWVYATLGDPDRAFEWLGKAYEERSAFLPYSRTESIFNPLRKDPRFNSLMEKVGFKN